MLQEEGDNSDWEDWAKTRFENFDPDQLALLYGAVIDQLFPLPRERQQEVERLTSAKDPSVGYALLAVLIAHEEYGPRANVILTTNFDDLMADSMYLLTRRKPLVVVHESLAPYARASRSRPLIVKLHGDARLAPRNTPGETKNLDDELRRRISSLVHGSGLIFCGYGGNDHSIARFIRSAEPDAFPLGIYWVGTEMPTGPVGSALKERPGVFHVPQDNFDRFMIGLAEELDLTLPGFDRWRSLFQTYERALDKQVKAAEIEKRPREGEPAARLRRQLDASRLVAEARLLEDSDPDQADEMFRQAIAIDRSNVDHIGLYAEFLKSKRKDFDQAEELYQRALELDPNNAAILGNYAILLHHVRHDVDRAEEIFRRVIDLDAEDANDLANYAQLLFAQRRDNEAEVYAMRAWNHPNAREAVLVELAFYYYAHRNAQTPRALDTLAELLLAAVRSPGWDFSPNLTRLKQDGDKQLPFLTALADVISGKKPLDDLVHFKEWRDVVHRVVPDVNLEGDR
jgi:Tfp pilus assembly protein PilF